jgi:digeranylgeranylglycerophospholipid reductase
MQDAYDIVVIGAGPAGCAAALKAVHLGANTLLIEKHAIVGKPVCCAEGITTFGLERIVKPRPEWISASVHGARLIGPQGGCITFQHPDAGYILNREKFDSGLAEMAVECGAELITSASVTGLSIDENDIIENVTVVLNEKALKIRGKIFIAADGVESRVAYLAGIDTTIDLGEIDSACQYLVSNIKFDTNIITIYIGNEIAPGGYAWVFPKGNETANIGVAICPKQAQGRTAKEYLDNFMAVNFPAYKLLTIRMGVIPAFDRKMPLLKGNLLITGDAARVVDSLSGAGISNALVSGSLAGEVAALSLQGRAELVDYRKRFMKLKARELYAYRLFRSLYLKVSDQEFEQIITAMDDFFPEKKIQDIDVPDIIFKLLFKNPSLLKMARYLIVK